MKTLITISLDHESGEARLTPRSKAIVEQMVETASLADYDQLSDVFNVFRDAFERLQIKYDAALARRGYHRRGE